MKPLVHTTFELRLRKTGVQLQVVEFGDFLLLRNGSNSKGNLTELGRAIYESNFDFVCEVIATQVEILLSTNGLFDSACYVDIAEVEPVCQSSDDEPIALPIWFGDGEDWDVICEYTALSKEDYIERLLHCDFQVAMIGFLPGFVYLDGLPDELQVPRKANPSTRIAANTLAIGGKYAGVYSLPSPAGWNSVGRLASQLFEFDKIPPMRVKPGDAINLKRIDEATFYRMNKTENSQSEKRRITSAERMGTLQFLKPGMQTLLQDRGRSGLAYYAIPRGGPMDATAADVANAIVGNQKDAAVIECHFFPPEIEFQSNVTICLTGADMHWQIDGSKVGRNRTIEVVAGSKLTGSSATDACRGYIAIRGEIDSERTFGSMSCYLLGRFGGNNGMAFAANDLLQWTQPTEPLFALQVDRQSANLKDVSLRFIPGPEFDWLNESSKQALAANSFAVSSESNRMGARLEGPVLSTDGRHLDHSVPLLPGMVQLTPAGQCIIVLQDGQTTGGYPRIGYLNSNSVERLNQVPMGKPIYFEIATEE